MSTRKISQPDSFRANVRKQLEKILLEPTMSINLEKAIFNYAIQEANFKKIVKKWENECFAHLYIDRLRTMYLNFKNEVFLDRLLTGDLTPHTAVFMTHQEMNPGRWHDLIEKKKILDANKFTNNAVASTDLFTCGRCKSKKCTFYTAQTRSADEAETIFITCLDCGKNWKKN